MTLANPTRIQLFDQKDDGPAKPEHQLNRTRESGDQGRGLKSADFRKVSPNGLGEGYNAYPHAMTWFQDHLYVGVTRAALVVRGRERSVRHPDCMGEIWPVRLPENFYEILRAQIWRYQPADEHWSKLYTAPMVTGSEGFEVPLSSAFRCMTPFQGPGDAAPALYIPTWGTSFNPVTVMLRSADGVSFEVVSEPGLGIEPRPRSLRGLVPFKGWLFTSPAAGAQRYQLNVAEETVVLVSSDPVRGQWQLACEPFFGDPNNRSVFHMAAFNGCLYAGTLNINEGYQIWKTDAAGDPPFKWEKIISHGAYRGKLNQAAMTLQPFRDHLYVGSAIQLGGFDIDNNVGPGAPELIRINPDDSWDLVAGEPRFTPDGLKVPISGLGAGFGDPFAGYLWSICAHDGWLYVGNLKWLVALRYAKRGNWPDKLREIFSPENLENLLYKYGGCDLWRSQDGCHWEPITLNGFGNCFNYGIRNMVSTPHGLFVGMANPYTPEVAVKRIACWNYEENSKGGLEIWLGSHEPSVTAAAGSSDDQIYCLFEAPSSNPDEGKEISQCLTHVKRFYEGSDFCTLGFWKNGISAAGTACENLMEEILAFIPEKQGKILDFGCGLGATTGYLLKYFKANDIVGVTPSYDNLKYCRRNAPGVTFIHKSLLKYKLKKESFDYVISIEGAGNFKRKKMFQDILRILKPGGLLIGIDILPENIASDYCDMNDKIARLSEYNKLFLTGFEDIHIVDITHDCLKGFEKGIERYFEPLILSRKICDNNFRKIRRFLQNQDSLTTKYVLISAKKCEGLTE
jgi:SAM-dependent methyltransferase